MKVFVNVSNLHLAGGLSVGIGIVKALLENPTEVEYIIYIPNKKLYNFDDTAKVRFIEKPVALKSQLGFLLSLWTEMRLIKKINPDKVFTLGNIPMITWKPQLVMIQWAYLVYPDSVVWSLMDWKEKAVRKFKIGLIKSRLSFVKAVTVQTHVMKQRFEKHISQTIPVHVVTSAFAPIYTEQSDARRSSAAIAHPWKILCLTRYYSHKNLEVLIEIARLAQAAGDRSFQFILTLDNTQPQVKKYFRTIQQYQVNDYFHNLGTVPFDQLPARYSEADAFILPTLLETVGLTFYEAMHFNKLIFAPDLDFAREVCKDCAIFFDPMNASDIYDKIRKYSKPEHETYRQERIKAGEVIVRNNGNWDSIVAQYEKILIEL